MKPSTRISISEAIAAGKLELWKPIAFKVDDKYLYVTTADYWRVKFPGQRPPEVIPDDYDAEAERRRQQGGGCCGSPSNNPT